MISNQLFQGDSYEMLRQLCYRPEEQKKYRLIVTSPPYYGHRHYGQDPKEIGQERTAEIFIEKLVDVFKLCRELLTEDGSLWIVIGDTRRKNGKLLVPHRLAIKLVEQGYTFREDIIWYKKIILQAAPRIIFLKPMRQYCFFQRMKKVLPTCRISE